MTKKMLGIAAAGITTVMAAMGTANAADQYGAIAYSPSTGAHGWANNYSSREIAEALALRNCTNYADAADCYIAAWVRNWCMSFAQGTYEGGRWPTGFAVGPELSSTNRQAMEECSAEGRSCRLVVGMCARGSNARAELTEGGGKANDDRQ